MAVDEVDGLSDELDEWVDRRADELGVDPETVVRRVLAVHREIDRLGDGAVPSRDDGATTLDDRLERLDDRVTDLEADVDRTAAGRVADLETRLDSLSSDLDEMVGDVRERVVQVKRETDAKAASDHDHAELREAAERAAATAEDLEERVDRIERRLDEEVEGVRDVLDGVTATSDELGERAETLARVAVDLRRRVADLEAKRDERRAADDLRRTANRHGDATATCEACGRTVRLGLLSTPRCPHCDASFGGFDPSGRLFGSATLRTGQPPALDGESEPAPASEPPGTEDTDE
jgi:rubrerythrin